MCVRINPSILSADFLNFETELSLLGESDMIHVDVMDNNFVPNLTFGVETVRRMAEKSPKPLDVHLMIANVDSWAADYVRAGAAMVTFHVEAAANPVAIAGEVHELGAKVGLAVKPSTELEPLLPIVHNFDQLLIMTVEPGFGGQKLIEGTLAKVTMAREYIDAHHLEVHLQVDGGIDESNIARVAEHGADTFVAGSAVFKNPDRNAQIALLRAAASGASAK